jgi:hypothetical protein
MCGHAKSYNVVLLAVLLELCGMVTLMAIEDK